MILGVVMTLAALVGAFYSLKGSEVHDSAARILLGAVSFGFVALGSLVVWSVLTSRLTLYADAIESKDLFSVRRLRREEIVGRRILPTRYISTLVVVPRHPKRKSLKIAMILVTDEAFDEWFDSLPDLDAADLAQSQREMTTPGKAETQEDRSQKIAAARTTAKLLNGLTVVACAWAFFRPIPYEWVVSVLAFLPLISLFLLLRGKGVYQIEGRRNDARANLAIAFLAPGLILDVRAVRDIDLLRWQAVLIPGIVAGIVLTIVAAKGDRGFTKRRIGLLPIFLFGTWYCCSAIAEADAIFDQQPAQVFRTNIAEKHVSRGKSTTYHLRLDPWGPQDRTSSITVSRSFYESLEVGQAVCVWLKPGALKIPWYVVRACR